jgi:hypothetical protein
MLRWYIDSIDIVIFESNQNAYFGMFEELSRSNMLFLLNQDIGLISYNANVSDRGDVIFILSKDVV